MSVFMKFCLMTSMVKIDKVRITMQKKKKTDDSKRAAVKRKKKQHTHAHDPPIMWKHSK